MSKHPRVEYDLAWLNRHNGSTFPGLLEGCDRVTDAMWNSNLSQEARLFLALKLGWDSETPAPVWTVRGGGGRKSRNGDYTWSHAWTDEPDCFTLVEYVIWAISGIVWKYVTVVAPFFKSVCVMWSSIRVGVFLEMLVTHCYSFMFCSLSSNIWPKHE